MQKLGYSTVRRPHHQWLRKEGKTSVVKRDVPNHWQWSQQWGLRTTDVDVSNVHNVLLKAW